MLYSSCKGPVTDVCEQQFNITIAKKVSLPVLVITIVVLFNSSCL